MAMMWRRVVIGAVIGFAMLTACSGSEPAQLTLPPTSETSAPATTGAVSTTEAAPTSSTVAATDEAVAVWAELLGLAADRAETDRNSDVIATLTTPEIDEQLNAIFLGEFPRELISNAVATDTAEVVKIQDCLFLLPGLTDSKTVWFSGTVGPGPDGGLIVTEFNVETIVGCVPADLAETILTDYQTYWDSRDAYFNPPNPDAPELAATTTSSHREFNMRLAERFATDGQFLQGKPEPHAEIHRFDSPTEVLIVDCQQTDPERGVYSIDTGERTDVIPSIEPDQRDGLEVTMHLEDGTWKIAESLGARGFDCEFAPTELGIPLVPPSEQNS